MKVKLRSSSNNFQDIPIEIICQKTRDLGFNATEVLRFQLMQCKTPELVKQFAQIATEKYGLEICALNNIDFQIFEPFGSRSKFDATLRNLKEAVDIAENLGTRTISVLEGRRPKGVRKDSALLERLVALFGEALDYAKPKGIGFITEPHPFTVGMDLAFLAGLCDSLPSGYFGVLYDCCHFGVGKPTDYVGAIHTLGNRIKHIHFADCDLRTTALHYPPGMGKLKIDEIIAAFKNINYNGTITLDLYGYPMPEEGSKIGLVSLKEAQDKLGITN